MDMLWSDKRICEFVISQTFWVYGSRPDQDELEYMIQKVRDEYEARIAELESSNNILRIANSGYKELTDKLITEVEANEARIAELEAQKQRLLDSIKRLGVDCAAAEEKVEQQFAENCELQGRIAELEAEKKAKDNYIESLESQLTPEQIFDASN